MPGWLRRLADESHSSEYLAARWHLAHAVGYGLLIVGYVCMVAFHLSAAQRHEEAAARLLGGGETWCG